MFGKSRSLFLAAALLAGTSLGAIAGSVTPLANGVPYDGIIYGWLLTDGSLLYQGGLLQDFYRFRPDNTGSYLNGTYHLAASLPPDYVPYATSGGVLPDGRVLLIGGEYLMHKAVTNGGYDLVFALTNKMAVYDPVKDTWTPIEPPSNWGFIGDSPWAVLNNGHLLLGDKLSKRMAELDPATLTWTEVSSFAKDDVFAEEGLTLLPDGSVLTVNMTDYNFAQRFIPNSDPSKSRWEDAGATPEKLPATDANSAMNIIFDNGKRVYHPPGEIGPAILRPDGTVFATGAACTIKGPSTDPNACTIYSPVAHTAIYDTATGSWTAGPDLPHMEGAGDTFASLLPDGNVLIQTNPPGVTEDRVARARARYADIRAGAVRPMAASATAAAPQQSTCPPTKIYRFYEFDGAKLTFEPAATFCGQPNMLLLPTGEVMLDGQVNYESSGLYQPSWAPTITKFIYSDIDAGGNYQISGTQFNGLSQANAYGDEFQVSTNFPLVRITNTASGHVKYARTYNFSTMAVATGSANVSTWFAVPTNIETGASTLVVVANGIPSQPINVRVKSFRESAN
jgi:hypothetical protein